MFRFGKRSWHSNKCGFHYTKVHSSNPAPGVALSALNICWWSMILKTIFFRNYHCRMSVCMQFMLFQRNLHFINAIYESIKLILSCTHTHWCETQLEMEKLENWKIQNLHVDYISGFPKTKQKVFAYWPWALVETVFRNYTFSVCTWMHARISECNELSWPLK